MRGPEGRECWAPSGSLPLLVALLRRISVNLDEPLHKEDKDERPSEE